MEPNQQNTDLFGSEVKFDDTARRHLASVAQWAMIVVVTTIIGYIISLLEAFMAPTGNTSSEGFDAMFKVGGEGIGGTIFWIIIGLTMNYFLYQFAVQTRKGLSGVSQDELAKAFRNLRIYFTIFSIVLIIAFLLVLIVVAALS